MGECAFTTPGHRLPTTSARTVRDSDQPALRDDASESSFIATPIPMIQTRIGCTGVELCADPNRIGAVGPRCLDVGASACIAGRGQCLSLVSFATFVVARIFGVSLRPAHTSSVRLDFRELRRPISRREPMQGKSFAASHAIAVCRKACRGPGVTGHPHCPATRCWRGRLALRVYTPRDSTCRLLS